MSLLCVNQLGKAFRSYRSEWHRVANWFGMSISPSEETWVLKDVSFTIQAGEAIGIIGQNGAGKSTLLKIITGTQQPTEGHVNITGRIAAILELGLGFNPELTGKENVIYGLGLVGFDHCQIEELLPEVESFADIGDYFDQPMRVYSSGMLMRVAFAVSTASVPSLLIVDEALSVGDAMFQRKCFRRIEDYMSQGMSLLLVSHDLETIKKICPKTAYIEGGRIIMLDDSKVVCDKYERAIFGYEDVEFTPEKTGENDSTISLYDPALVETDHMEYGDGRVKIGNVWLENEEGEVVNVLQQDSCFTINYIVDAMQSVEDPVFAFLIKSIEGVSLYGADTQTKKSFVFPIGKKERFLVRISMKNCLTTGVYFINCGVRDGFGSVFMHRKVDVTTFKVLENIEGHQVGIVDMGANFHIEKIDGDSNTPA
jgi:lipopolysaccharide transport system ATP-binding protein